MSEKLLEIASGFVVGRKKNGRCIYSVEGKRALVEACLQPGVSVAKLALTHGVNANLVRKWITAHRSGLVSAMLRSPSRAPALLSVIPVEAPLATRPGPAPGSLIEIVVRDATIRLRGQVDAKQLRTVVDCLVRRP